MKIDLFPFFSLLLLSCYDSCDGNDLSHVAILSNDQHIKLMSLKMSHVQPIEVELSVLKEKNYSSGITNITNNIGMGSVPVLNQGQEGTCVTFSSTAALDALLNQGDFISQQCSLELDLGLGQNYWDGADEPSQIIDPLKQYGVVKNGQCDNLYPCTFCSLSSVDYLSRVDSAGSAKIALVQYSFSSQADLNALKSAIDNGHRVLIAFHLQNNQLAVQGFNAVVNGQMMLGGLWACQQPSSKKNFCGASNAGHEVLVIGYDDDQQLLLIRNSWGPSVGDAGNYYMTYPYFNSQVENQTEVW
jgi:papain like protease